VERSAFVRSLAAFWFVATGVSCSGRNSIARSDAGVSDAAQGDDVTLIDPDAMPPAGSFCSLPGSVVSTPNGPAVVPGATVSSMEPRWLNLPVGFCAHYFATVKTVRQLKFAPGGDLFAASPTTQTTGGAGDGVAGVVVLPDDNRDGVADSNIVFLGGLPAVQGLMFDGGFFYYQDGPYIRRVAFRPGDRAPSAPSDMVTAMTSWPQDALHWPKVFDKSQDGTIYISNGGAQGDVCDSKGGVRGAIVTLNADGSTSDVARGFRNPIALRCESAHNVCLVVELALDYSWSAAGREKIVPIRQGDDWGYPCCATQNAPYAGVTYKDTGRVPDCSRTSAETASFVIGHTPFGIDFETGQWPSPWSGRAFVTLHGDFASWIGARIVAISLDPNTGVPLPASELSGSSADPHNMLDFATGWDDGLKDHGRPAPVSFAPDGRMFVGDDQRGAVIWIAPVGLMKP
jgi:glucose/arabinose dehydrogenase